jgi:hypothetical protein
VPQNDEFALKAVSIPVPVKLINTNLVSQSIAVQGVLRATEKMLNRKKRMSTISQFTRSRSQVAGYSQDKNFQRTPPSRDFLVHNVAIACILFTRFEDVV